MADDNTRINPKHYIGRFFDNIGGTLSAAATTALVAGVGTGTVLNNSFDTTPDEIGTDRQEIVYQQFQENIASLSGMRQEIDIAKAQMELDHLRGLSAEELQQVQDNITGMKFDLGLQSKGLLFQMLTHGETGAEADISERQFLELSQQFAQQVMPPEDLGMKITPHKAAVLDDARIKLGEKGELTGNPVIDAGNIYAEMKRSGNDRKEGPIVLGVFAGFLGAMAMLIAGLGPLSDMRWRHDPRIRRREKPKRTKKFNH